jgi:uncharacterized protein (DUF1778 family)
MTARKRGIKETLSAGLTVSFKPEEKRLLKMAAATVNARSSGSFVRDVTLREVRKVLGAALKAAA